jgi:RHS repeat-associated protein
MFWSNEVNLNLTKFRAYDPNIGRWLSKDPLENAEVMQGINLFAYVQNDPVNLVDPSGLQLGPAGPPATCPPPNKDCTPDPKCAFMLAATAGVCFKAYKRKDPFDAYQCLVGLGVIARFCLCPPPLDLIPPSQWKTRPPNP